MHEADAIVYDSRCQEEPVLAMARRDAERLPVDLEEWVGSAGVSEQLQALLRSHGRLVLLLNDMPSEAYGKLLILLAGVQRSVSILTSAEALSLEIQAMPS